MSASLYLYVDLGLTDHLSLTCSQVAALSFGDFYNAQYVKMYNVFMVQLQVRYYHTILMLGHLF